MENKLNELPLTEPCPVGWQRATIHKEDGTETTAWINPDAMHAPTAPSSKLTEEQKERVRKIRWALKEHDPRPEQDWFRVFELDTTPEREISIMEAIARIYKAEIALNLHSKQERRYLYAALILCSTQGSVEGAVGTQPALKAYKHLDEVYARYLAYLQESWTKEDEQKFRDAWRARMANINASDGQHRFGGMK
jgi:hypothetical protein